MSPSFSPSVKRIRILVVEQLREPTAFVWSLIAPIAFLFMAAYQDGAAALTSETWAVKTGQGLAYIAAMTSFFNFGMFLIGRREGGFIRSFLTCKRKRWRFLLAQFGASYFIQLTYGVAYLGAACLLAEQLQWQNAALAYIRFAATGLCMMAGAAVVAAWPLTFQSAHSLISVVVTSMIVPGLAFPLSQSSSVWRCLNPFPVAAAFISGAHTTPALHLALAGNMVLCVTLACVGIRKQRINPEWSNR